MTQQQVRGHGKVELFDDLTGRLYRREKFENFISVPMVTHNRWSSRQVFEAGWTGTNNDPEPGFLMNHFGVWSDTSAENPATERFIKFPPLGHANKSAYAGADLKRGTPNTLDSLLTPPVPGSPIANYKFVFEWPTHAANGTFQSVGWVNLSEATPSGYPDWLPRPGNPVFAFNMGTMIGNVSNLAIDRVNDKLYTHNIVAAVNAVREYHWTTGAVLNTLFTTTGERCLAYDPTGTPGWWTGKDSGTANPCAVKRDAAGTIVGQINNTWNTIMGQPPGALAFDGTYLWATGLGGATGYRINPANSTFVAFAMPIPSYCAFGEFDTGTLVVPQNVDNSGSNTKHALQHWESLATTPAVAWTWMNAPGVGNYFHGNVHRRPATETLYTFASAATDLTTRDLSNLATRTLLGSPVTKLGTQTMKITYNFDFS